MKKCLVQAANGAVKKKFSYYKAKCDKLTIQTGSRNKAKVAIANRIARLVYKMIKDPNCYFIDQGQIKVKSPETKIKNLIGKLKKLGVDVQYQTEQKIIAKNKIEVSY